MILVVVGSIPIIHPLEPVEARTLINKCMYYTVYKVTNEITGKIYIGCHKTSDLNDTYMGSGKYLRHSIDKHGIENFTKEILFVYDNPSDMFAKEAELVTADFIAEENTYNLKVGGQGGFDYINHAGLNGTEKGVITRKQLLETDWLDYWRHRQKQGIASMSNDKRESQKRRRVETMRKKYGDHAFKTFLGKTHSTDTKKKISEANQITSAGKNNSQYGTMWITNGSENQKIKRIDTIPEGWEKGRTLKN